MCAKGFEIEKKKRDLWIMHDPIVSKVSVLGDQQLFEHLDEDSSVAKMCLLRNQQKIEIWMMTRE